MIKEEKICSYTAPKKRIQLLKITDTAVTVNDILNQYGMPASSGNKHIEKYQIRENRKIRDTCIYESTARKRFANLIISEILQQNFTF